MHVIWLACVFRRFAFNENELPNGKFARENDTFPKKRIRILQYRCAHIFLWIYFRDARWQVR